MKIDKKYIILISLVVFSIIILVVGLIISNSKVHTKKSNNGSKLPEININSSNSKAINIYLDELYQKYTIDGKSKFNYNSYTYDNILSLLIDIDKYDKDSDTYSKEYMSFNVDNETGNFINIDQLLNKFGISIKEVSDIINEKLKKYYQDEALEGYIDQECTYEEYLDYYRGINLIMEDTVLVIENNKLVAYTNFDVENSDDVDYFKKLKTNVYRTVIKEL